MAKAARKRKPEIKTDESREQVTIVSKIDVIVTLLQHEFFVDGELYCTIEERNGRLQSFTYQNPADESDLRFWEALEEWCRLSNREMPPLPGNEKGLGFSWHNVPGLVRF